MQPPTGRTEDDKDLYIVFNDKAVHLQIAIFRIATITPVSLQRAIATVLMLGVSGTFCVR